MDTNIITDSESRCSTCVMVRHLCICQYIPKITTETRLIVLMHFRELNYSSNTGRLASLCLPNSEVRLRGLVDSPVNMENLVQPGRQSLVLQLCDEAIELDENFKKNIPGPYNLIVPDGNWRQATKMHRREPVLKTLPKIKLPVGLPSRYRLRKEHKVGGLSTIEAIARAMGYLENPSVQKKMEDIFELMVEKTLTLRPWLR